MPAYFRYDGARLGALLLVTLFAHGAYAAGTVASHPVAVEGVLPQPLSAALNAPVVAHGAADTCQITIGKSRFDYGRFNKASLSDQGVAAGELVVGRQTSLVTVICPTPQRVAMSFRAAGDVDGRAYRFGEQGKVRLALLNAQADGQRVQLGEGDGAAPATAWAVRAALTPGSGVTLENDRAVSRLSVQLETLATVPAQSKSPVTAQRWSDGGQLQLHTY